MSHRIDSQMMQIHQRCTQGSSEGGKKISQTEALQLIRRAHEINETHSSSYSSESRKGNKYLLHLMDQHKADFSPDSEKLIQKYIRTGKVPSDLASGGAVAGGGVVHHGGGHSHGGGTVPISSGRPGGSVPSTPAAGGGTPATPPSNGGIPSNGGATGGTGPRHPTDSGLGNAGAGAGAGRPTGPGAGAGAGAGTGRPSNPGTGTGTGGTTGGVTPPSAPVGGGNVGTIGPNGKMILDFKATKSTWGCHWFPMQETRPGGDATNNLYAEGGALSKLDLVTGGKARQYEWDHNRKAVDAGKDFGWWGHCNNASEAACILPEPKRAVVMTARDGSQVKFTRNDIQGLLVKCTSSLVSKVDFKGERFNSPARDNPNDPAPTLFLQVMQEWAKDGIPFVLDIDRGEQVWNFPYDQVKIFESDHAPEGVSGVPSGAKYYHIEMVGSGFAEKNRVYECWVAADGTSGWVKTPNTHNNPDFMWRPHVIGDVMDKGTWQLRGRPSNPEVDPQVVYEIYMKSLA